MDNRSSTGSEQPSSHNNPTSSYYQENKDLFKVDLPIRKILHKLKTIDHFLPQLETVETRL